jgi:hypothetical protein
VFKEKIPSASFARKRNGYVKPLQLRPSKLFAANGRLLYTHVSQRRTNMTPSITFAMPQKLRGVLFLVAGTFLFALLLGHSEMAGHLVAVLGLTVNTATAIVEAILTGSISSLPTTLQALAASLSPLVLSLLGSLGISGVIAF